MQHRGKVVYGTKSKSRVSEVRKGSRGSGKEGGSGNATKEHKASQMEDGKDKERFHLQVFQVFLVFQPQSRNVSLLFASSHLLGHD